MSRSVSDVSIITVNWNGKQHLSHLVPSLVALLPKEVIVVDNGSQDDSVPFLKRHYPQVKVIQNPTNEGFAEPNNLAARSAQGTVLAFINNDMRADSEWLNAALERMGDYKVVGSRILDWDGKRVDFNGSSLQYLGYALQQGIGEIVDRVTHEDEILFACGGAMLIDRDLFLQVGGFDKDFFAVFEDVDLGWRLWLAGERIAFAPESVTYHRGHATLASQGSVKMRYLMHRNALLTIIKNYEESTFRRILPLALVMAVKRAVRCSGVRKESFYLWSNVDHDVPASESMMEALNHLVAVEDVLESLPRLLARRSRVQALRKKSDEEILALFRDPLRPIVEDPEYVAQELEYLKFLDLDRMFPVADYERFAADLDDQLSLKIRELRNELEGIQWQGVRSLAHPNNRSKRVGFLQLYRSLGIRKALAYSAKKFRRGL